MKKRLALVLAAFLLLSLCPLPAQAAEAETDTAESVILASAEDFLAFAESCWADGYSRGVTFELTADIDLTNTDFAPIPYFAGIFLGHGHSILGLSVTLDGSRQGLFRQVAEGGVVRDVRVKGSVTPGGTASRVGGIAGENNGSIERCVFEGSVAGLENVGGIAGLNGEGGVITDCVFRGDAVGEHQAGGIAGRNQGLVEGCTNNGSVNTVPITPSGEESFDLSSFSEDDFLNLSNTGGIAGENSGVVSQCRNNGAVGYAGQGYNVGGVAGKSAGYITGSDSYGAVKGRRDVGGVVGQLIPYVAWDLSGGTLDALSGEIGTLQYLLTVASRNSGEQTGALKEALEQLRGSASAALSELSGVMARSAENQASFLDRIEIDPETGRVVLPEGSFSAVDTSGLTAAINSLYAESATLAGLTKDAVSGLTADLNNISRQMQRVFDTLSAAMGSLGGGALFSSADLSVTEYDEHDMGAVSDCVNYGAVSAENNAGGVAGVIDYELSFDMEDTLNASELLSSEIRQYLFAVLRRCGSYGEIQVKKDNAGGVVGSMSMGAVVSCVGAGAVAAQSGDYVGGVAGASQGAILNCWSRTALRGGRYVGGVAGLGNELRENRSWTYIERFTEYGGAVAGWAEGEVSGNLYAESRPAGVDGVSLTGQCDALPAPALLALEGAPEDLDSLTVTFVAEGRILTAVTVPFGGSVTELPAVENRGEQYWKWDDFDAEHIYYSVEVGGRYYSPGTTISSGEELPLFLVEGVFYEGQELTAAPYAAALPEEEVLAAYTLLVNDYDGALTVRMRSGESGRLYLVGEDGALRSETYRTDGQYIVFTLPNGGSFVYVRAESLESRTPWLWIGLGAAAALLAALLLRARRKKKKTASTAAEGAAVTAETPESTETAEASATPETAETTEAPKTAEAAVVPAAEKEA